MYIQLAIGTSVIDIG